MHTLNRKVSENLVFCIYLFQPPERFDGKFINFEASSVDTEIPIADSKPMTDLVPSPVETPKPDQPDPASNETAKQFDFDVERPFNAKSSVFKDVSSLFVFNAPLYLSFADSSFALKYGKRDRPKFVHANLKPKRKPGKENPSQLLLPFSQTEQAEPNLNPDLVPNPSTLGNQPDQKAFVNPDIVVDKPEQKPPESPEVKVATEPPLSAFQVEPKAEKLAGAALLSPPAVELVSNAERLSAAVPLAPLDVVSGPHARVGDLRDDLASFFQEKRCGIVELQT